MTSISRASATDPFWSSLPAPAAQAVAARSRLTSEAKLMFELGITSPSVDMSTIQGLYDASPADEMACGVSAQLPVSAACVTWANDHHLIGKIGLCQRMLSSHVVTEVFDTQLDPCLDLIGDPALAGTDACAVEVRGSVETVDELLFEKSLSMPSAHAGLAVPQAQTNSLSNTTVNSALANIDRWYTSASVSLGADPTALTAATSRMLKIFWTQLYGAGAAIPAFATGSDGTDTAKQQLALFQDARLGVDRQVLAAAFADPAPLDEVPLLLIVGDAFTELVDRLRAAAPMYDVACRIKGGCTVANANEATQLIRLISAIGDDTALAAALATGTGVRQEWLDVFTALRARADVLQSALRKATGRPGGPPVRAATLADLYLPNSVAPAAALADRLSASLAMWNSYTAHGVLMPRDNTMLRTSLVDSKVFQTLESFKTDLGLLGTKRMEYQQDRGNAAKSIVDLITSLQFQTRVDNEMASSRVDYANLSRDLDGLTLSQDHAEQEIGKFLATYIERARSPGWLPDYPVQGTPAVLPIDATQARGSGGLAADVPTVAVHDPQGQTWKLDVADGDMLTFDVANTWSPTCALRSTTLAGPSGTAGFTDPTHLQVGPEGFSISWQNDHYQASDHTSADVTSQTDSSSICGSISGQLLNSGALVGTLSLSGSTCRQWQTGHSETDSTSSGSRFQYAASFAGGLRVPGTPFPTLPGGALLLVEVIDGTDGTSHIRDVHVVRAHASFVFPQAARVYLVANDKSGCSAVDTHQIVATYTLAKSTVAASRALAGTMAAVLSSLQAQKALYVAQGSVTATELSSLQTSAYDQLRTACNCNLSAYPEEVRGMFDAWLGAELASIERATRLAAAERALDSLVLRLKAYNDDLTSAQSSARLLALLTHWSLSQLGHTQLQTYADAVLNDINGNLMPMMQILYPQALVQVAQLADVPLTNLRSFDWTLPYDEQAMLLETVSDTIRSQIEQVRSAGGQSVAPLVVVFPKPGAAAPAVSGAVIAPAERLGAVWQPCTPTATTHCLRQKPSFSITPEDVYGRPLVGLGCGEAAPVVQTFALIAVNTGSTANDSWNTNPRRADISRAADMVFPTENGVLGFRTDGVTSVLAPSRVRVLASTEVATGSTFDQYILHGVDPDQQGISPFDGFTVDLGTAVTGTPLSATTAMVAYFEVQARTATGPLKGVGTCAQPLTLRSAPASMSSARDEAGR